MARGSLDLFDDLEQSRFDGGDLHIGRLTIAESMLGIDDRPVQSADLAQQLPSPSAQSAKASAGALGHYGVAGGETASRVE